VEEREESPAIAHPFWGERARDPALRKRGGMPVARQGVYELDDEDEEMPETCVGDDALQLTPTSLDDTANPCFRRSPRYLALEERVVSSRVSGESEDVRLLLQLLFNLRARVSHFREMGEEVLEESFELRGTSFSLGLSVGHGGSTPFQVTLEYEAPAGVGIGVGTNRGRELVETVKRARGDRIKASISSGGCRGDPVAFCADRLRGSILAPEAIALFLRCARENYEEARLHTRVKVSGGPQVERFRPWWPTVQGDNTIFTLRTSGCSLRLL